MTIKPSKLDRNHSNNIKADVIILGCSLSGIVTAHKLKKKFGNTMDIIVLDLAGPSRSPSKYNVAFQEEGTDEETQTENQAYTETTRQFIDNVARHYLIKYAKDFSIPIPDAIIAPESMRTSLNKLFQYKNGSTVHCANDYHDFDYLSFMERIELNQYQMLLDQNMQDLFRSKNVSTDSERKQLLYYDQTTMEKHICDALLFSTSREIMRNIVRLVCGVSPNTVSVLFYLHQCHRTSNTRNHLDGDNVRFREKLLGYCRKRLANKLQRSIADITLPAKKIKKIRTYSDEAVILETIKGDTNYVCNLLAMALRPDELNSIRFEEELLSEREVEIACAMVPGRTKKFFIQYEENFWRREGYSGDILSIRGPIIWAMERPRMSTTGSLERYAALVGYLKVKETKADSKSAVLEQLVKLFGDEAGSPVNYKETNIADVFVPRCGDYVTLRRLAERNPRHLEWGALDVFADGDVAAALEAGHIAYLHLLSCLRPQAQTYEDVSIAERTMLFDNPLKRLMARVNYVQGMRLIVYTSAIFIGMRLLQSYMRK